MRKESVRFGNEKVAEYGSKICQDKIDSEYSLQNMHKYLKKCSF